MSTSPPKVSKRAKAALGFMTFLLRRGWMGPAGDFIMVITTTGRKTGKRYSIPIGYLVDGDDIFALTGENTSNWFRNVVANGEATLEIKKKKILVLGEVVTEESERQRIFALHRQNPRAFKSTFGVEPDSSEAELQAALAKRRFIRFKKA